MPVMSTTPVTLSVSDKISLLEKWESDLKVVSRAHYDAAVSASQRNLSLGIPATILSAIVGSTVFGALSMNVEKYIALSLGILSLCSAILTALQTFLRWPEVAEKHRIAGGKFGAMLKEIEHEKVMLPKQSEADFSQWCFMFRSKWDAGAADSPPLPRKIWLRHLAVEGRINEQLSNQSVINKGD
jgi:hypothetical protein